MSAASSTPAQTFSPSPRPQVTTVKGMVFAHALVAVCAAGGRVALHFSTDSGIVLVHCPLSSFLEVGRAAHDSNGHSFPTLSAREAMLRELAIDAEASAPKGRVVPDAAAALGKSGVKPDPHRRRYGDAIPGCVAAWQIIATGDFGSIRQVADDCGVNSTSLHTWILANRQEEYRAIKAKRRAAKDAVYEEAMASLDADIHLSIAAAAKIHGITDNSLHAWLSTNQRGWLTTRNGIRRTVRRGPMASGSPMRLGLKPGCRF